MSKTNKLINQDISCPENEIITTSKITIKRVKGGFTLDHPRVEIGFTDSTAWEILDFLTDHLKDNQENE